MSTLSPMNQVKPADLPGRGQTPERAAPAAPAQPPAWPSDRYETTTRPGVAELERFRLSLSQAEGFAKAARKDPSYRASAAAAFREAASQSLTWEAAQRVAQSAQRLGFPEEAKDAQARAVSLGGPTQAPRPQPDAGKVVVGAGAAVVGGALMGLWLGRAVLHQQR